MSTWWDTSLRPGENFRNEIDDQLNACKAAVIIWTPEAVKSDWVIAEADHARQQKKLVNTHVPEIKPHQIPKPFNQSHSVEVANRAVIIDAIRTRIAQHGPAGEPRLDAPANSGRTREEQAAVGHGRRGFLRWSYGLVGALAAAVLATLVGLFFLDIVPGPTRPTEPIPKWDVSSDTFIGEPIPLAWKFDRSALVNVDGSKSEAPILFELSSSSDARFGADTRMETYADGDRKFMWHINATRFWRVRAVESRTEKPLTSDWSLAIRITQYDSAYDRIKATGKVLVYVSNAEIQGTFKWVDAKGLRGVRHRALQVDRGRAFGTHRPPPGGAASLGALDAVARDPKEGKSRFYHFVDHQIGNAEAGFRYRVLGAVLLHDACLDLPGWRA